jgi:hypothetical protein
MILLAEIKDEARYKKNEMKDQTRKIVNERITRDKIITSFWIKND